MRIRCNVVQTLPEKDMFTGHYTGQYASMTTVRGRATGENCPTAAATERSEENYFSSFGFPEAAAHWYAQHRNLFNRMRRTSAQFVEGA